MVSPGTSHAVTRRRLLKTSAVTAGGLTLTTLFTACSGGARDNRRAQGSAGALLTSELELPEPFQVPLPIPEVLEPTRTDADTDYYR
ncbi:hypothetical protein [Kocuria sp.]|uniref:hypothetical protein n=1 Tax=Kocuria sp. TaxID=1871328 RepID=UPI0026E10BD3|nr:hypothetical protein [Kocuria sp.]MDO5618520.1 hypothetical protein [Kocuria sp.]